MTKQDYYEVLDATLTDILDKAGVEIDADVEALLLSFNRTLMAALGLTN